MTSHDLHPAPAPDETSLAANTAPITTPAELGMAPAELGRLINSVILPGFVGTTVPQWLEDALRNGLAGVVYFAHNIDPDAPEQVRALSGAIRTANPHAVIGVDEEGGNVTRLQARDGSTIPGAAVLGALNDPAITQAAGRAIGRLCREAGINLTIAPVADVNTNPRNPVIGVRAFGADTALVSRHTAAAVAGIQQLRVAACAKHFPGHGDTVADSHMGTARVELTMAQLAQFHLPPFRAAVAAGVASMMSAHIIIPELGGIPELPEAPATLHPAGAALLREMGFEGVLITDALDMAAVRATVGAGEGGVLALLAGNDLLCVGNPLNAYTTGRDDESCYREVYDALHAAALSGRLPLEVLRRAAARARALAEWAAGPLETTPDDDVDWVSVAARACRTDSPGGADSAGRTAPVLAGAGRVSVIDARTGHNMAAGPTENFLTTALENYAVTLFNAAELSSAQLEVALMQTQLGPTGTGTVLVLTDSLNSPEQLETVELAIATAPQSICINAGLMPAEPTLFPTIHCHGFSRVSAHAVVQLLEAADATHSS